MRKHSFPVLLSGTLILLWSAASAQDVLEEIVVTATKRGAINIQDVPYSIASVDEEYLVDLGAVNFYDYARRTGIQAFDEGPGQKRYIIRGLHAQGSATVGLYYDDIPTTGWGASGNANGQPDFRTIDLERIEILRGPQGTLYGAGSVGGTIRYVTNKPNPNEFEGSVAADFASVSQGGGENVALDAVVNVPLVQDTLGFRLVGFTFNRDGIVDNPFLGFEGVDYFEGSGGRAMLQWTPNDAFTATLSHWKQDSEVGDRIEWNPICDPALHACYTTTPGVVTSSHADHISTQGVTTPYVEDMDINNLTLVWESDAGTFTSSSSWFNRKVDAAFESSDLVQEFMIPVPQAVMPVLVADDSEQFSQELLFSSSLDGPMNFVVGYFYQERNSHFRQRAVVTLPTPGLSGLDLLFNVSPHFVFQNFIPPPINNGVIFDRTLTRDYTNTAFFGELNWQITDQFALDLGLRSFELSTDLTEGYVQDPDFVFMFIVGQRFDPAEGSTTFDDTIFKATASMDFTDDIMGYATFSEGFREGGVNPIRTATLLPIGFESDQVTNLEFGAKFVLADGRLVINTAIFDVDWSNLQTGISDPTGLFGLFVNEGDAGTSGLEFELSYQPAAIDGLSVLFGAQRSDTARKSDVPTALPDGSLGPGNPMTDGRAGDPFPNVADWMLSGNVKYDFVARGQDAWIMADWSYIGESFSDDNPINNFGRPLGDYHLLGVRMGLTMQNGWGATIYANNLFDEDGALTYNDRKEIFPHLNPNAPTIATSYPRTVGFSIRKEF